MIRNAFDRRINLGPKMGEKRFRGGTRDRTGDLCSGGLGHPCRSREHYPSHRKGKGGETRVNKVLKEKGGGRPFDISGRGGVPFSCFKKRRNFLPKAGRSLEIARQGGENDVGGCRGGEG